MSNTGETSSSKLPKDWLPGLFENYKSESISGFLVFLIALPLCLGISKASGFPSIAGIYTAIIGGLVVSLLAGSIPTIKGPAAGLIVIALGAVTELGKGDLVLGYKLALATIVVSGAIQVLFGLFKAGVLSDFFPHSVVHGMLAAIGIIIFSKQIHIALGVIPTGKEPIALLEEIPNSIVHMNPEVAIIGAACLAILFLKPLIKHPIIKIIPGPLFVLMFAIPMGMFFDFQHPHDFQLIGLDYHVDPLQLMVSLPKSFLSGITFPDFSQVFSAVSIKYIIMFALVGSIESLLSAKAIDAIDPYRRQSNMDKDLFAVGVGNVICGFIGGLPMISEIVRSSANINNGGKTRWANFFHGAFLLGFVVLAAGLIQMIPNAALAAMLIFTGYNLAAPKEFIKVSKIGPEQLLYFVVTIIVTLSTDLLVGVFFGIGVKIFTAIMYGVPLKSIFRAKPEITKENDNYFVKIKDPGLFTNVIPFKNMVKQFPKNSKVTLDFEHSPLVDYTFQENLHKIEEEFFKNGGHFEVKGFDRHHFFSEHPQAIRLKIRNPNLVLSTQELNPRQSLLSLFADQHKYDFDPSRASSLIKFSFASFVFSRNCMYGENLMTGTIKGVRFMFADIMIKEQTGFSADNIKTTVLYVADTAKLKVPNFQIEKEGVLDKIKELQGVKDIDFDDHPIFSEKYFLIGDREDKVRKFFTPELISLFENTNGLFMEAHSDNILIHADLKMMQVKDYKYCIDFLSKFIDTIKLEVKEPQAQLV
ncbi:MAG: SulP family inorganic anion transporter [Bacteroidota bacterium]|nr:SulP family inorganic anion transporter [Bacteroidota bacterium]